MSTYIVGYTVNGQNFALRSWYLDSVWAVAPVDRATCNIFRDYQTAEKYYKKAVSEFRWNLKPQFRGGKVWIRKTGSSKNPFHVGSPNRDYDWNKYGWDKVPFSLKTA